MRLRSGRSIAMRSGCLRRRAASQCGIDRNGSLARREIDWQPAGEYEDIRYELGVDEAAGIAKITINRPEVHNAFRPETVIELSMRSSARARTATSVSSILTGGARRRSAPAATSACAARRGGYVTGADPSAAGRQQAVGRFHVTDLHVQIRRLPKPMVAMVAGYAIGGGHVLHVVCDLTIAADNARFGQTGPKVGSFDGGFGASRAVPARRARRRPRRSGSCAASTTPRRRSQMGLVNTVVPLDQLETETVSWCREMLALSPFALRMLKASFNADEDGLAGIQQLAHDANLLFYMCEEAQEGRKAYLEKRTPDFSKFPRRA